MNRAFLIIGVPAFVVSVCWMTVGWGWRVAVIFAAAILVLTAGLLLRLRGRRQRAAQKAAERTTHSEVGAP